MNGDLSPGKAAIIRWMDETAKSLRPGRLAELFVQDIKAGEYVLGLEDFLKNVQDVGWSDSEIERLARQLKEACELANRDPHPEYLSEAQIDEFVETFKLSARRKHRSTHGQS